MANEILQKKDPFQKTVSDMWKNKYRSKYNRFSETNNGMNFTTGSRDEPKKRNGKKKTVTFYKCNKTGHKSDPFLGGHL